MMKYSAMSVFGVCAFMTAFAPPDKWNPVSVMHNWRPLAAYLPKFDSNENHKYYMGSDQLVQSAFYFWLLSKGLWNVAFAFMAFDLAYYGPMTLGGLVTPIVGALTLL